MCSEIWYFWKEFHGSIIYQNFLICVVKHHMNFLNLDILKYLVFTSVQYDEPIWYIHITTLQNIFFQWSSNITYIYCSRPLLNVKELFCLYVLFSKSSINLCLLYSTTVIHMDKYIKCGIFHRNVYYNCNALCTGNTIVHMWCKYSITTWKPWR